MTEGQKMKTRVDSGEEVECPKCKKGIIKEEGTGGRYYTCNNCDFIYRISVGCIRVWILIKI